MHIICLTPLEEGVYNDHKADHITYPPEGWAYIPEDFPLPSTFPRMGSIEAEEVEGVMTVTAMTEGTLPEPEPDPGAPDTPGGSSSVWYELDAAYQEGVDSV